MFPFYFAAANMQDKVGAHPVFHFKGLPVNDTTLNAIAISIFLVVFSIVITRKLKLIPGPMQNAVELLIEAIVNIIEDFLPGRGDTFLPFIGTIAIFVGISNIIGILPLTKNPTADLNMTLALGIMVFLVSQFYGIKRKGFLKYLKGFTEPVFLFLPMNIIGEIAKPISHSFRLYGNLLGGGIIIAVVAIFAPGIVPVPLMAWFDLFIGIVQAVIFTMLAVVYLSMAGD